MGRTMKRMLQQLCVLGLLLCPVRVAAVDRTTCFFPLSSDSVAEAVDPSAVLPDDQFGDELNDEPVMRAWGRYLRVWRAHQEDPSDQNIRRFLGLSQREAVSVTTRPGRSAPDLLRWRPGSYAQLETPHFQIFSRAERGKTAEIANDLERCFWVWTQFFFPLWEAHPRVGLLLDGLSDDNSAAAYLAQNSHRLSTRRKLRIVVLSDAAEYQRTLQGQAPGITQSTGFYSDKLRLTFLFPADPDDAATRRHELVHQLFYEASRSRLRTRPGETNDFWLVEGSAGYFESLRVGRQTATLGGWDAPRLQFARYRVLVGGDQLPLAELSGEGMADVQRRSQLGRWYTLAIAHTHRMLDSEQADLRLSLYRRLADLYKIPSELFSQKELERGARDDRLAPFLRVSDMHLIENQIKYPLSQLCLAGCEVTADGLETIPTSRQMNWLDLSRLPIEHQAVARLVPDPASLTELNLEATAVSPGLAEWLQHARGLNTLDLSWTQIDDTVAASFANMPALRTLWLTGTRVTDDSLDVIAQLPNLKTVDLQRTPVSESGIQRLKAKLPHLTVNPLELRKP